VVQLFVHHFSQLELFRRAEIVERVLCLVKNFLLPKNGISILEGILQESSEFVLLSLLLFVELVHLEEKDAGLREFEVSVAVAVREGSDPSEIFLDFGFFYLSQEVAHIIGIFGVGGFSRGSAVHLPFLLVYHFSQIFALIQHIISFFLVVFLHAVLEGFGSSCEVVLVFGIAE